MKRIMTVVGARPQFIKAAVVSKILRKHCREILVHTGQHYDYNMSEIFFEELQIPAPDYNLGIRGGTHGEMTSKMLKALEELMLHVKPDAVLLYGDTNSTMASALAAVKLLIPVIHVEAGNRLGTLSNPEEVNRIVTDHVSSLKLYCTHSAGKFLEKEGISDNSYWVGDPMYDAFLLYSRAVGNKQPEALISIFNKGRQDVPLKFNYMTCHRQENTRDENTLHNILLAMEQLPIPCIYPVHPRNIKTVKKLQESNNYKNIIFCQPVGYLMSIYLVNHSSQIVTDSGGLQREAFFAGKQCVTVFDYVAWPETMCDNRNQLATPDTEDILKKLSKQQSISNQQPFGDGHASEAIVDHIKQFIQ
jgi:UDP-N-acetylglucosamine 2-epimerase